MTDLNITSLESRVKAEWNVVHSRIALHPYITVALMIGAGWVLGHMHIPV